MNEQEGKLINSRTAHFNDVVGGRFYAHDVRSNFRLVASLFYSADRFSLRSSVIKKEREKRR